MTFRRAVLKFRKHGFKASLMYALKLVRSRTHNYRSRRYFDSVGEGTNIGYNTDIRCKAKLGARVTIDHGVVMLGSGGIVVGDGVYIGHYCVFGAESSITIGNDTMIAANCYIVDSDHGTRLGELMNAQPLLTDAIVIGRGVWIAAHVVILRGSQIGDGAVVGANSVVKGIVPENAIVVGNPARVIKCRVAYIAGLGK